MKKLIMDKYGNWNWQKIPDSFVSFHLPDDTELLVTDWQIGHECVSFDILKNLVSYVLRKPHRFCILQDFLDDNWLSRFVKISYSETQEAQDELKRVSEQLEILKPIYHRFLFQIGSNHGLRRFGLDLPAERSQQGRSQFNRIYGEILEKNKDFVIFDATEVKTKFIFESLGEQTIIFLHPSRLGSPNTALSRVLKYLGADGVAVGHIHSNIKKEIQGAMMDGNLKVWFASHLFAEQPEYEKERMATFEPSKPLVLGWKHDEYLNKWEFDAV